MSGLTAAYEAAPPIWFISSSTNRGANSAEPYFESLSKVGDLITLSERTKLTGLASLPEDWDGYGSAKPNAHAIQRAMSFIKEAYTISAVNMLDWKAPHISASEDGEVVFEWWGDKTKLTIYIGQASSEYIKVWGPNISNNMHSDSFNCELFPRLWSWLVG